MAELSPATRAIVAAFNDRYELCGPFDDNWQELCLAAALRALADQVVQEEPAPQGVDATILQFTHEERSREQRQQVRASLLSIAAELDGSGEVDE